MPSTIPYVPTQSFGDDPNGADLISAAKLDTQLRLIAANIADLIASLDTPIRDDNTLTDAIVRLRNLHPEITTYLDSRLLGAVATQALVWLFPCRVVSTVNISALSALPIVDGVQLIEGDRVLLVGQTNKTTNGIWVATNIGPAVWARPADYQQGRQITQPEAIIAIEGTIGARTSWAAATGETVPNGPAGPIIDDPLLGDIDFVQVWGPFPMPIARGGTGATTAAGARANLGTPGKHTEVITGDGVIASFGVTHNLNTQAIIVGAQDAAGTGVVIDYASSGPVAAVIVFALPPSAGELITITIIG